MKRIYGKTVKEIIFEYCNKKQVNEVITKQEILELFAKNYPKIKRSTLDAHLIGLSTNSKNRIHYNIKDDGRDDLFVQIDINKYRLYNKSNDPTPYYKNNAGDRNDPPVEKPEENDKEFAYEKDLQNFIEKNLNIIEPELKLFEEDDINGIEFPAGGRFIDILAVDKNNNFVIIELKVSRGYDRVIGQLLRYISWVKKNMATEGQKVRGIIICKEITEDLVLACSEINNIELFEYELSIKLKKIEMGNTST